MSTLLGLGIIGIGLYAATIQPQSIFISGIGLAYLLFMRWGKGKANEGDAQLTAGQKAKAAGTAGKMILGFYLFIFLALILCAVAGSSPFVK